jgi:hypothetical protein
MARLMARSPSVLIKLSSMDWTLGDQVSFVLFLLLAKVWDNGA